METSERIIELNIDRKHFEEIYFKDVPSRLYFSADVKPSFIVLVVTSLLFITSIVYSLITDNAPWLIVVLLLALIMAFIAFYVKFRIVSKWKYSILKYLNELSKIKVNKCILNETTMTFIQDDMEMVVKWTAFSKIIVEKDYFILFESNQYLFPRKSMEADDYDYFLKLVKGHIKNGL